MLCSHFHFISFCFIFIINFFFFLFLADREMVSCKYLLTLPQVVYLLVVSHCLRQKVNWSSSLSHLCSPPSDRLSVFAQPSFRFSRVILPSFSFPLISLIKIKPIALFFFLTSTSLFLSFCTSLTCQGEKFPSKLFLASAHHIQVRCSLS